MTSSNSYTVFPQLSNEGIEDGMVPGGAYHKWWWCVLNIVIHVGSRIQNLAYCHF